MEFQHVLSPSTLLQHYPDIKEAFINWDSSYQMLAIYQTRLYYYRGPDQFSLSWDMNTKEEWEHHSVPDEEKVYNFAFVEINGKIWKTGGFLGDKAISKTFFLHFNFTWLGGPDLPAMKESHTMISISNFEVFIMGGNLQGYAQESANKVWLYNDKHQNFTLKSDFKLGSYPSAVKTYIKPLNKEVIIVMIKEKVYFYDWLYDAWIEADNSWIHPVSAFERVKLFASDHRFLL